MQGIVCPARGPSIKSRIHEQSQPLKLQLVTYSSNTVSYTAKQAEQSAAAAGVGVVVEDGVGLGVSESVELGVELGVRLGVELGVGLGVGVAVNGVS